MPAFLDAMGTTAQLAKHFRDVHFGGNWTAVDLRGSLKDVTWQEAVTRVGPFNTIGVLVFHIHYYVGAMLKVLEGGPLEAHDKYSFDLPPIVSDADWQRLLAGLWSDAERFAMLVERLPEERLAADFVDPRYGSYHRNLLGVIEHTHYHLGQIVLIRKLLREGGAGTFGA